MLTHMPTSTTHCFLDHRCAGWPTIRYFNKETGYGGKAYTKKTSDAMCTELGNDEYMQQYIEEAGSTSLCSIADGNPGCGDKEKKYIAKWTGADAAKVGGILLQLYMNIVSHNFKYAQLAAQTKRLEGMASDDNKMKADLKVCIWSIVIEVRVSLMFYL